MRAAIYARLSKDRSGLSVNVGIQEAEAREYAAEHGHEVVAVHSDNDLSASRYSSKPRPGYEALWRAIESGSVEAVIVQRRRLAGAAIPRPRQRRQILEKQKVILLPTPCEIEFSIGKLHQPPRFRERLDERRRVGIGA